MKRKRVSAKKFIRYKIYVSGIAMTNPLIFFDAPVNYMINSSVLRICKLPFLRCVAGRQFKTGRTLYFVSAKDFKALPYEFKKELRASRASARPRGFSLNGALKERNDAIFSKYHDIFETMIKIRVSRVSLRNPIA